MNIMLLTVYVLYKVQMAALIWVRLWLSTIMQMIICMHVMYMALFPFEFLSFYALNK